MRAVSPALRAFALLALVWVAASCIDAPLEYRGDAPPEFVEESYARPDRKIVALALGSGGPRVIAQIGVLKALEEAGIEIDLVVGTSGGAVLGALWSGGHSADDLARLALETSPWSLVDPALSEYGSVRGDALARFVDRQLDGRRIEALNRPFAAVVTHVETGALEIFNRGHAATAVRASAAIPGLFFPVRIAGEHYVDGEIRSPVPIRVARQLGADVVIAVDVQARLEEAPTLPGYPAEWLAYGALRRTIVDLEVDEATALVQPELPYFAGFSREYRRRSIEIGYRSGRAAIERIKKLIGPATEEKKSAERAHPNVTAALLRREGASPLALADVGSTAAGAAVSR
jgi:NTE family protein